jgi:hypothetical protein
MYQIRINKNRPSLAFLVCENWAHFLSCQETMLDSFLLVVFFHFGDSLVKLLTMLVTGLSKVRLEKIHMTVKAWRVASEISEGLDHIFSKCRLSGCLMFEKKCVNKYFNWLPSGVFSPTGNYASGSRSETPGKFRNVVLEKISWTDHVRNEEVLLRVSEQRNILHEIRKRKANWIGHILRRNCLLKEVIERKIQRQIEVTRRRGRRRKKLLDDLGDRRGYSHLKDEALDRTKWRNRFGRGCGPVVWQITDDDDDDRLWTCRLTDYWWMNE